jgi:ribose transport system ATP-binding protein
LVDSSDNSTATSARVPVLEAHGLSKQFAGIRALDDVSLAVEPGEVLAIVGENGAGKSTLMKILAGVQRPTAGTMRIDGREVEFSGVRDALRQGIALIHQELNLAPHLDVATNISLGREPNRFGFVRRAEAERLARKYLKDVGLEVSPRTIVSTLPIGKQQLAEIAKALSTNARVLIMDEPTSSLSQFESEKLFQVIRDLRSRGVSILYVSHRLGEVEELADRVVVLRDGRYVGDLGRGQIDRQRMVSLMVGRNLNKFYHRMPHEPGKVALRVTDLRVPMNPQHRVNFALRAGEIVGIAGLVGAGRSELLTTLFGVTPAVGGQLELEKSTPPPRNVGEAIAAGMMLVPEDRRLAGLLTAMTVRRNLSLASLRRDQWAGFLNRAAERQISAAMIPLLRIKASAEQIASTLSGGNQQKVVLGKWLAMNPTVLLLDEPTRGIDVGAKEEIYGLLHELAGRGVAILFVSSEMEEVLGLADRVLVMHEGRIAGELPRSEMSETNIMKLATGQ